MNKGKYYITTPIYYPSDKLHIGHAFSTVMADTVARYKRMQGYDVMFLTGTDEHGQKIEERAKAKGVTPKEFVDDIVKSIKELWKLMNISNDRFIRTTDDYHEKAVQKIFRQLYDKGDIYKGTYKGLYCTPCEAFWTETQLVDGKCPDCGREVKPAEEEAYFFRLSKYQDKLLDLLENNPTFLEPASRRNEMINFIKQGLDDLCVSRTAFSWGIPVDFDPKHVVYVWLDALTNYITALGYGSDDQSDYEKYWPADIHLIGKEIVRFHTVIWPAILMALDLPLPKKVLGHGWLVLDGGKMSKSKGNVVDPKLLCDRYGVDAIRYFLLREVPFGSDGLFSNEGLISRINSDLANDLGNLVSRSTAMTKKYFDGIIPSDREAGEFDDDLISLAKSIKTDVEAHLEGLNFNLALADIWKLVSRTNKYIDETMPWVLAKNESKKARLGAVIYNLCEVLRIISILITPFMPSTAPKISALIGGGKDDIFNWDDSDKFGLIPDGCVISTGDVLFPRIDAKAELEFLEAQKKAAKETKSEADENAAEIDFDTFGKIELIAAKITSAEKIKKSKKLIKLQVDDGRGGRQIVSGIADYYTPEELIGKTVAIVANLKPAKLCGELSNGMILAADNSDGVKVLFLDGVDAGAKIR